MHSWFSLSYDKLIYLLSVAKELRTEVENLAARLHYMEEAKEDVRADIAVMRRAAEKADTEVAKAETEKKKQVLCGWMELQPKTNMPFLKLKYTLQILTFK